MSRVLVVGASGFIGGALVGDLAADGVPTRALVRRASTELPAGVERAIGDVTDLPSLHAAAHDCAVVVNLAGVLRGAREARQVNVDGARNVCAAAAGAERLVHVSSAGVYGFRRPGDVDETTTPEPGPMPYPATKLAGERAVLDTGGPPTTIVRPALVYGPGSPVWTTAMFRLARRRRTVFLGDGSGLAPVVHVADVVSLIRVLIAHGAAPGEVFNCAADPVPTWREFLGGYAALAGRSRWLALPVGPVRATAGLLGRLAPAGTPPAELPGLVGFLTGRRRFRVDKAARLLGWHPRVGLAEGIASCAPALRAAGLLDTPPGEGIPT
jgi:nucleoside-diphosphate-sugar epimerase